MNEAQRDVALFRYSLIREAADESLSTGQRGQLVRELAAREHVGPRDRRIRVGRGTIDRWIRAIVPAVSRPWPPSRARASR